MSGTGRLFVVATPIGNLEDMTFRAVAVLKEADIIACEDTRHTRILATRYMINRPLVSYHNYNEAPRTDALIRELLSGKKVALVSDAGTPGISDPGYVIIKAAIDNGIPVEAIPGPSAILAALAASGKPTHKFIFEGFLSNKSSQRQKRLQELKDETRTLVFYESPHRLLKFLNDVLNLMGDRDIVCARELTKKFEEVKRGKTSDLIRHFSKTPPRGEFVIII